MPTYVTSDGLTLPLVVDIKAEIDQQMRDELSPLLHTEPDDLPGNVSGIMADQLRQVSELVQVAYKAFDPDAAEGDALDSVLRLTGSEREGPTKARFAGTKRVTVNLEPAFTLPIGSMAHILGDEGNRWVSIEAVMNPGVAAADFPCAFEAETPGTRKANPGTLTVITTPVAGWNSITNPTLPIQGSDTETDEQARARRERELKQSGSGTVDAMTADIFAFEYDGESLIRDALVLENVKDIVDPVTGLPPHSMECIIDEGIAPIIPDDALAQLLWDRKPGGIHFTGSILATAIDKKGVAQPIRFTRPSVRFYQVAIQIAIDPEKYGGINSTRNIIMALADTNITGAKVRWSAVVDAVKEQVGVLAVNIVGLNWKGDAPGATFNDLAPAIRQRPLIELLNDIGVATNGS